MTKALCVVAFLAFATPGCIDKAVQPPTTQVESELAAAPPPALPVGAPVGARGYVHSAAASLFHLGTGPSSTSDERIDRVVGSEGVIATDRVTGAVRATLYGRSAVNMVAAFHGDGDAHNARVVAYFRGTGLPPEQIGGVHVMTLMEGGGPANTLEMGQSARFVSYTSSLMRSVQGIPVPDSFAAARFNENDETTMEWVYWPPIPQTVIDDAIKLKATLADPVARAAYLGHLPADVASADGEVTIRHSDFADSNFTAFASYDVHAGPTAGRPRGRTVNFDVSGNELIHPNRRIFDTKAPSSMKRTAP